MDNKYVRVRFDQKLYLLFMFMLYMLLFLLVAQRARITEDWKQGSHQEFSIRLCVKQNTQNALLLNRDTWFKIQKMNIVPCEPFPKAQE